MAIQIRLRSHFNSGNHKFMNKSHMRFKFIFIFELFIANFTLELRAYTTFISLMSGQISAVLVYTTTTTNELTSIAWFTTPSYYI